MESTSFGRAPLSGRVNRENSMARRIIRNFKPRTPSRFRERELARALRAAKAAGSERVEVNPATGKITVIVGGGGSENVTENEVEN
jgi:hypothetical protein